MAALVRYSPYAGRVIRAASRSRYGRSFNTARRIFNTGRAFAPYARMAINTFRSRKRGKRRRPTAAGRKKRVRMSIGQPVGVSNAKHSTLSDEGIVLGTKTKYGGLRLLALEKNLNLEELNTRTRDSVNFRGVKICLNFKINNKAGFNDRKMCINVAVVKPKQLSVNTGSLPDDEWFRGTDGTRSVDFNNTTLSGLEMQCLPINSDKYHIMKHTKSYIGPFNSTEGRADRNMMFYVKVNRSVKYQSQGTGVQLDYPEDGDMWLVWWASYLGEATASAVSAAYTTQFHVVRYFREPKN